MSEKPNTLLDLLPFTVVFRRLELSRWPPWASRWLGYRSTPAPKVENEWVVYFWTFWGSFCSIAVLQAIFGYSTYFESRQVPSVVGSFGASALLCFEAIKVPFAQPRALVGGHVVSAFVGIAVSRLIGDGKEILPQGVRWLAAALSTALAILAMRITGTTHPPAGATALLVAADPAIYDLGWYYLPVVLLSAVVVLVCALFFNNVQRQYPVFWISPKPPAPAPMPPMPMPESSVTSASNSPPRTSEEDSHLRRFLSKLQENTRPITTDSPLEPSPRNTSSTAVDQQDDNLRVHELRHSQIQEMIDLERGTYPHLDRDRHLSV